MSDKNTIAEKEQKNVTGWFSLITLIALIIGGLLLFFGITGIVNTASPKKISNLYNGMQIEKAGKYYICYYYSNFNSKRDKSKSVITYTFTNKETGTVIRSDRLPEERQMMADYGRVESFASVNFSEPGTYDVSMAGIFNNVNSNNLNSNLSPNVAAYKPFEPMPSAITKTVIGGILVLAAIIIELFVIPAKRKPVKVNSASENTVSEPNARPKSRKLALFLAIFPWTGFLGIDRMYLGYIAIGIFKFFTAGGFLVLYVIDIVKIANGTMLDSNGNKLV